MIQKILFTLLLLSLFTSIATGQPQGTVTERQTINSSVLGHKVNFSVYLPPDYNTSTRYYPVVYLLHGFTGNETDWVQYGTIDRLANEAISNGTIVPTIIVMPDADSTWYINDVNGKARFEDMMVTEFIPIIEKKFRIRASKEFRAIAGLSMGGFGSLVLAMRHPDLFSAAAGLSAAVITDNQLRERLSNDHWGFTNLFGTITNDTLPVWWSHYSVLHLAETTDASKLSSVRWWLDCGDDDHLFRGNAMLNLTLIDRKINHEYRVRNGGHSWEYWRTGIIPALQFISAGFSR